MSFVMVSAREMSAIIYNAPTYVLIQSVLARANGRFNGTRESKTWMGRWVGSSPRVTRKTQPGSATEGFITQVAWLWEWNDANINASNIGAYNQQLQRYVQEQLRAESEDWQDIAVSAYVPGTNGTEAWWRSGGAAVTQTRNEFPTGVSRLGVDENPFGPTDENTVPQPNFGSIGRGVGDTAKNIAIAAGAILGMYLIFKGVSMYSDSRRYRMAMLNPMKLRVKKKRRAICHSCGTMSWVDYSGLCKACSNDLL
jgi:hypothetical protein